MVQKKYTAFQQLRELAVEVARNSSPEQWQTRPCETALAFMQDMFSSIPQTPESVPVLRATYINILTAGLWNTCGRPVVTLGHKTAAACATTRIRAEDAKEFVRPPWPAFVVRLPAPLLGLTDKDNRVADANTLFVVGLPARLVLETTHSTPADENAICWFYKLCADVQPTKWQVAGVSQRILNYAGLGVSMWGYNMQTEMLLDKDALLADVHYKRWDSVGISALDDRADYLAKYIVVNTCLYIESPNSSSRIHSVARNTTIEKRTSKPDEWGAYTNYEVQTGILLNLSDAVKTYLRTGKAAAAYALEVQPHWKRVVHGPGRTLRRLQYIEAYWRGGKQQ